jgi:hypothetical protein
MLDPPSANRVYYLQALLLKVLFCLMACISGSPVYSASRPTPLPTYSVGSPILLAVQFCWKNCSTDCYVLLAVLPLY